MLKQRWMVSIAVAAAAVIAPIAWYLISPLFVTRRVDESFPMARVVGAAPTTRAQTGTEQRGEAMPARITVPETTHMTLVMPSSAGMPAAGDMTTGELNGTPGDATTSQTGRQPEAIRTQLRAPITPTRAAPAQPVVLLRGQFHDVVHHRTGTATIYRLADGTQVLRLENVDVVNGPALYVWLSAAPDAHDSRTIRQVSHVEIGPLKGNKGNQNYEFSPGLAIDQYHAVTIWWRQFSVNFITDPLR